MPHITIKTLPGKTPQMKAQLALRLTDIVCETFQVSAENISISVVEVPDSAWTQEVVLPELIQRKDCVVKFPEYPYQTSAE